MRRRTSLVALAAVLLASTALFLCYRADSPTATLKPFSLRLKWFIYSSFASHFVALEEGDFRREGLQVTIQPGGPGLDPIRLVASGVDDVGLAGHEQIIIAREKGLPLVAIGEDYVRSGVGFFTLPESGITKPDQFVGRRVGIMPGTDKHTSYLALLNKLGIAESKITEIPVAFDSTLLLNGVVEVIPGFITKDPFVFEERGHPVTIIDPFDYGIRLGGNVYFTTEEKLRTRRKDLKAFLRATIRGIIEAQRMDDGKVVDIVLKYNEKLNRAAEIKIWHATKTILLEKDPARVGYMYDLKWQQTAKIAKETGLVKNLPPLELCYTNELVDEIHREGH